MNRPTMERKRLRVPAALAVTIVAGGALAACGPEQCFRTHTADGGVTNQACEDDAGCFRYTDPDSGEYLFTDCKQPDGCSSVRTYPDGARGPGGNYC